MKNSKGFTLLEILIVLTLIGGMAVLVLPRFSTVDQIKSSIRKINVTVKQIHNQAQLSNTLHRLVIELSENEENSKNTTQSFYVEVAQNKSAPITYTDEDSSNKNDGSTPEKEIPPAFSIDTKILKKKETLSNSFFFDSVEYKNKNINSGKAYIYFYPQGYITHSAIHISNRKKIHYTLLIHPLTGQVHIYNEDKKLQEFQQ